MPKLGTWLLCCCCSVPLLLPIVHATDAIEKCCRRRCRSADPTTERATIPGCPFVSLDIHLIDALSRCSCSTGYVSSNLALLLFLSDQTRHSVGVLYRCCFGCCCCCCCGYSHLEKSRRDCESSVAGWRDSDTPKLSLSLLLLLLGTGCFQEHIGCWDPPQVCHSSCHLKNGDRQKLSIDRIVACGWSFSILHHQLPLPIGNQFLSSSMQSLKTSHAEFPWYLQRCWIFWCILLVLHCLLASWWTHSG